MVRLMRGATIRYALVAVAAFALGGATVVTAATEGIPIGSVFYITTLNGSPTLPCNSATQKGSTTTTCNAVVDSNGNLHVAVQNSSASPTLLGPTKASQLVTLTSSQSGPNCPGTSGTARVFDQRVNSDGTVKPFTIPNGMVLVVTGLDWRQGPPSRHQQVRGHFLFSRRTQPWAGC